MGEKELRAVTQSLGFRYTPRTEIESRLARVRAGMQKAEMEALLVVRRWIIIISPGRLRTDFSYPLGWKAASLDQKGT